MNRYCVFFAGALLMCVLAASEDALTGSQIVSVGLFKNGLALIEERVILNESSPTMVLLPSTPMHGSFWVESAHEVEVLATHKRVKAPMQQAASVGWDKLLAGQEVTLHFKDTNIPSVSGRVLPANLRTREKAEYPQYDSMSNPRLRQLYRAPAPTTPAYLAVETKAGTIYVEPSLIAAALVHEPRVEMEIEGEIEMKIEQPVLVFTAAVKHAQAQEVRFSYLTKGLSWAPSYKLSLEDEGTLNLTQKAVIKNGFRSIENAEFSLISGFPHMEFSHVPSLLGANTTLADFFQKLAQGRRQGGGNSAVMSQMVMSNSIAPNAVADFSIPPLSESTNIHYQPAGKRSLHPNDALSFTVASEQAAFERVVLWEIPDERDAFGHYTSSSQRNRNTEMEANVAWDALRFKNPLSFPMTTAPALFVEEGHFLGQSISHWVNPGAETTLRVTKALSVQVDHVEHEVKKANRESLRMFGDLYEPIHMQGILSIANHHKESIHLIARRQFPGELLSADGDAVCTLKKRTSWSVNKRNELAWEVEIRGGGTLELDYAYSFLSRR
jgi:hypothetical protein